MPSRLIPPQRWHDLSLTTHQVATLSGATDRQVLHWTAKGYLTTLRQHGRGMPFLYSLAQAELCLLIVRHKHDGLPLAQAAAAAWREYDGYRANNRGQYQTKDSPAR